MEIFLVVKRSLMNYVHPSSLQETAIQTTQDGINYTLKAYILYLGNESGFLDEDACFILA